MSTSPYTVTAPSEPVVSVAPDAWSLYVSLAEQLPHNMFCKDRDGRFTYANARFCRKVGRPRSEVLGRTDADLFPAELATKYRADDERVMLSGQPYSGIEAHHAPTGPIHVQVIKIPVRDGAGRVVGIQGIFWDVPDSHRLEQELGFEQALLRNLLEASPDSIYFKDLGSRFLRASRSVVERVGIQDPAEVIGKTDLDIFSHEHALKAMADEQEIILTGRPIVGQMERELHRDGQERWVQTTKMPLRDESGAVIGTLGVSRDVTELKHAEDALAVAHDAAVESARLKSEFLANMSHEIRTPLNAVVGMSGLLLDTALDPDQRDLANTIRTSADVLLGIVNDILDFSKIEAGKMTIETVEFNVNQVIEEAADLVAESAQAKGLELVVSVAPDVPRHVLGDPGRIRQVLVNLLSNAVKFTEQGEVVVTLDRVGEGTRHPQFRWQVRDTGIGIRHEAQSRLFSAFVQADGSTTRRYGGTGLGLAICKRLVGLMGGEIGFTSEPEKGTTFWFTLPLELAAKPPVEAEPGPLDSVRVLVVDDNETNRKILHRQLAAWRLRDGSAASGPDALARLREAAAAGDPYQIVVLDMQMPDMDGMDVARAITSDPALSPASIVILTSLAYHPDEHRFRSLGISAYLTKPIKPSRLFDCLATLVGQRTQQRPAALPPPESPGRALGGSTLRVLVAEDNPVNQKVALRLLQKLGARADAVGNGQEALDAMARTHYDAVLMDCQMPELDGYEATARLREREAASPGEPRHYVIAVTAHALDGDRARCIEAGMDDYVSKPIRIESLAEALERSLTARPA